MPIIALIIALLLPRTIIVLLFLFTSWFNGVFNGWIVPAIGFIFMPYTVLWYSVVVNWFGGQWGLWQILIMVIAVGFDFSHLFAGSKYYSE